MLFKENKFLKSIVIREIDSETFYNQQKIFKKVSDIINNQFLN